MTPLKRGDPVKVRLHTGDVVEAVYVTDSPNFQKQHIVDIDSSWLWAGRKAENRCECRFVGPSCNLDWSKSK